MPKIRSQALDSKCFEICINPLQIHENFEGGFVDTLKRQNPGHYFNWSERYLNLLTLPKDKSQIG